MNFFNFEYVDGEVEEFSYYGDFDKRIAQGEAALKVVKEFENLWSFSCKLKRTN